ncbi:hypothetical protein DIE19_03625 [Burkholderia sp. Bp9126]|nr:hypothetical protein DIE19_03625 [Burkholderia sp. Bp9126]
MHANSIISRAALAAAIAGGAWLAAGTEEWVRRHEHEHDPWRHEDERRMRPHYDEGRSDY